MLLNPNRFSSLNIPADYLRDAIDSVATGANLRQLRLLHNLTQEDLSEALGMIGIPYSVVSISAAENGLHVPKTEVLQGLATLYRCAVGDLLVTFGDDAA